MKDRIDDCCLPQGHANQSRSSVTVNITLEYMLIRHFQRKQPSHAYHVNTMAVPWQVAGGMIQGPLCHRYYKVPMKKKIPTYHALILCWLASVYKETGKIYLTF